ncbi:protein BIC1-like [Diospyros lotus]|uniref:protein BIC1-like n=1 Tax=Diospyros lotus TaxID=55363 RepID=UPI0022596D7C|nr:protein BIC1-like [Diospyros lotus]
MASQAAAPIVSSHQAAAPTLPVEPKKAHQQNPSNDDDETVATTKAPSLEATDEPQNSQIKPKSPAPKQADDEEEQRKVDQVAELAMAAEENVRERLKRHRVEVAGRVWIPDMWGQEELLKDWIDCTAFDAPLVNSNIMLARAALIKGGRLRTSSSGIRIENSC